MPLITVNKLTISYLLYIYAYFRIKQRDKFLNINYCCQIKKRYIKEIISFRVIYINIYRVHYLMKNKYK